MQRAVVSRTHLKRGGGGIIGKNDWTRVLDKDRMGTGRMRFCGCQRFRWRNSCSDTTISMHDMNVPRWHESSHYQFRTMFEQPLYNS